MLTNHIGHHMSQGGGVGNGVSRRLTRQSQRCIAKTPSEMDIPKHGFTQAGCAVRTPGCVLGCDG